VPPLIGVSAFRGADAVPVAVSEDHPREPKHAQPDEHREPALNSVAAKTANRRTTIKEKKTHVRVHLAPFFGETRLNEIDRLMLDRFAAEMFEKTVGKDPSTRTSRNGKLDAPRPLSAKRIKNVMGTLRTILGTAHRWGVLEKLPEFPQIKTVAPTFDFYDATEAALLVASARDDERVLVLFALRTGARAGELLALEWTDVDLRAHQLVSFSKSRSDGFTTNGSLD
jgi:integrase